ncbi:MAG: DNA-binding protein [Shinella sp.]|nr:DNA-binding protein [Shinella sp.]
MGAGTIAKHLGITSRQLYRLSYGGHVPVFKLGGAIAARRSTLTRWLDQQETSAMRAA